MDDFSQLPNEAKSQYEPIEKAEGVTVTEKFLGRLCEKTFLSLWSYQCLYRDQGKPQGGGHGKEICDLLVVFDKDIIVFSDKSCKLQNSGEIKHDWLRWFKKAIHKSALQALGAERWIQQHPTRIFLDRECSKRLPIELPEAKETNFHLVVVAHGVCSRIRDCYPGGSGSLIINSRLKGFDEHTEPFTIGDLDPQRSFVHVFDEESLRTVMVERDTISDFVAYLSKREQLFRGKITIRATGEEQLLPFYLRNLNKDNQHDFVFPVPSGGNFDLICVPEGHWEDFRTEPQRIEQINQNKISYAWDELIEKFSFYALRGRQQFVTKGGLKDSELVLRFMAREPRWKRRYFAQSILQMIHTTAADKRMLRVMKPLISGDPYWVFLLRPRLHAKSDQEYRDVRRAFLEACCSVTKAEHPDAKDIIGIATESGPNVKVRTEDAIYIDVREWSPEMDRIAREDQERLGILKTPKQYKGRMKEYPDVPPVGKIKNPRNKPCPCGSGRKFKHCCLNRPK
jgi:hypothetical protein